MKIKVILRWNRKFDVKNVGFETGQAKELPYLIRLYLATQTRDMILTVNSQRRNVGNSLSI